MIYGKKKQLQGHFERGLMSADISAFAFKCSNQVLIQPIARQWPTWQVPTLSRTYARTLLATDYVSGMTDSFAVELYQRIRGISLP